MTLFALPCSGALPPPALSARPGAKAPARPADTNPLEGLPLYVDHESPSWLQWQYFTHSGQPARAT